MKVYKSATSRFGTNCYLLENDETALIIDPGEEMGKICDFAKKNCQKTYKAILLTHCHFDHIGGVNAVNDIFGAEVYIGASDNLGLADGNINASRLFLGKEIKTCADKIVQDGDVLQFGDTKIEVIATPGHTQGSVCYKLDDMIFSGDTLFRLSIGRYDLPTSDFTQLMDSLSKLKSLEGDYMVYPGHSEPTSLDFERKNNMYLKD